MFSDIYFSSHLCSKNMKCRNEITISVKKCFLVQGRLTFGIILHTGNHGSTLQKWLV
jgi:hypothetical protein